MVATLGQGWFFQDVIQPWFSISLSSEVPVRGPETRVENIGLKTATIVWQEIPKNIRNGFINSYTVFYQAEGGKEFCKCAQVQQNQLTPPPQMM